MMTMLGWMAQPAPWETGIDFWAILLRASWISKLVLLTLLFFSVISWAIIIAKAILWWRLQRKDDEFLRIFHRARNPEGLYREAGYIKASGYAQVFVELYPFRPSPGENPGGWTERRARWEDAVERTLNEFTEPLERHLGFLATTAGVAPFIGLFGTVLGIIAAFESIGRFRTADLSVVAPGIAEALVATAAGLAAAIPALVAYNFFVVRIRRYRRDLRDFASYVWDQWQVRAASPEAETKQVPTPHIPLSG